VLDFIQGKERIIVKGNRRSRGSRLLVLTSSMALLLSSVYFAAIPVLAAHTITISDYDETAHECGNDGGFKIEAEWVEEGEHTYHLRDGDDNLLFSVKIDATFDDENEFKEFDYSNANPVPEYVVVFGANQEKEYPGGASGNNLTTLTGQEISHISFCGEEEVTATATATATATPREEEEDNAALNIRKVDEEGNRLEGAVFTVEGMDGTFTTNDRGFFCITGLENDSEWLVTEIEAPEGYEIADEPSQMVEVDDDGDCNSPDAVFVNTLAEEEPEEPEQPEEPGGTTEPDQSGPSPTPREDTAGGNPTPKPRRGALPDTAVSEGSSAPIPAGLAALVALASLSVLAGVRFAEARSRR